MIGAGVVGLSVSWHLQSQGYAVTLIDPDLAHQQAEGAGSTAALGLLMAQVYRRSSGRGWRLRQRSLELWQVWRHELEARGHALPWRAGLLQLARDAQELQTQQRLVDERQARGIPLRLLQRDDLDALQPALPEGALGGLLSPNDGQLDPLPAMAALLADGQRQGMTALTDRVERLERLGSGAGERWRLQLRSGGAPRFHWLVLTAGLASPMLLAPLGHQRPQKPVLGQAVELQLNHSAGDPSGWPGALSWGGVNLVPRPGRRLWLGATLEPERSTGEPASLAELRTLGGCAPPWLREAAVVRQWQGLRARPDGRPAPLLEALEPGLLLASGHYRNGVLLAPASAAWVAEQIRGEGLT